MFTGLTETPHTDNFHSLPHATLSSDDVPALSLDHAEQSPIGHFRFIQKRLSHRQYELYPANKITVYMKETLNQWEMIIISNVLRIKA